MSHELLFSVTVVFVALTSARGLWKAAQSRNMAAVEAWIIVVISQIGWYLCFLSR